MRNLHKNSGIYKVSKTSDSDKLEFSIIQSHDNDMLMICYYIHDTHSIPSNFIALRIIELINKQKIIKLYQHFIFTVIPYTLSGILLFVPVLLVL